MERNAAAFDQWEFTPRVLRDVSELDTSVELLGRRHPVPLALSPTGFTRIVCPEGELAVARAAARKGIAYSLSTLSTRSIEEIREVSDGPLWFQLYFWRDRGLVAEWLQRAADCDYEALLVAVDTPVFGRRERDVRRGFTLPPTLGPDTVLDGLRRPAWTWSLLRSEPITFANLTGVKGYDGSSALGLAEFAHNQFNQALSWDDLDWLRERWNGKLVLKGVQSVGDAQIAAEQGVDGIILSNHGGRQLDGAPPHPGVGPPGGRRSGRHPRHHLRRRRPPGQPHRHGPRPRRRCRDVRPPLPIRPSRRRRTRRRPPTRPIHRRPNPHPRPHRRSQSSRPHPCLRPPARRSP